MSRLAPFPPDWSLGFIVASPGDLVNGEPTSQHHVGFVPIVGMEAHDGRISPIIALASGTLLRAEDLGHPIVCICAPDADKVKTARAGLQEYLQQHEEIALDDGSDVDEGDEEANPGPN